MVLNSASISARFVGGVIAPIMVLGAMLGTSFGLTVQLLFPNHAVPISVYMLVGVGAFIASAVELPVTAILLVLEMTQNYSMVLPIMHLQLRHVCLPDIWAQEAFIGLKLGV
jgi:CIC family chloride channel protein